jgi:AcrR family transcriptional regulator
MAKTVVERAEPARLNRDSRQQQIVSATARLIGTRGYADTSIRDVAGEVGISTGTLLHHFESKEQLLTATLLDTAQNFLDRMKASARGRDPRAQLKGIVTALLGEGDAVDIGWKVWIAFWHEAAIHPELGRMANQLTAQSEGILAGIIRQGAEQGTFDCPDPQESAEELAALIDGVAIRVYGEQGGWSHARAIATVLKRVDSWRPATRVRR